MQTHDRRAFLRRSLVAVAALGIAPLLLPRRAHAGPDMATVERRMQEIMAAAGLNATAAVLDLNTQVTAAVGGDRARFPGCTLNTLVLMSVLRDVVAGAYPLSYVDADIAYTIRNSSADRARDLLTLTGGGDMAHGVEKVNALGADLGMTGTLFDHPPAFASEYSESGVANLSTANDMNRALAALWHSTVLPREYSHYLIEKMTHVKPGLNYLIPAGIPADAPAQVGHKNGYFQMWGGDWVDNDIGLAWSTDPATPYAYAISMFFHDLPEQFGPEIFTGQRISSLAWHWFDNP